MASLSVERGSPDDSIVVAVFETPKTPEAVAGWLKRECEYRFLAVRTETLDGDLDEHLSVRCPSVRGARAPPLGDPNPRALPTLGRCVPPLSCAVDAGPG